jgi:hypothetical protein
VQYNTHTSTGSANYRTSSASVPNALIEQYKNAIIVFGVFDEQEEFVVITDE